MPNDLAEPLTARTDADNLSQEGRLVPEVANCLTRRMDKGLNTTLDEGQTPIVEVVGALPTHHTPNGHGSAVQNSSDTLVAFDTTQITSKANRSAPKQGDPCHPLAAGAHAPAITLSQSPSLPVSKSSDTWAVRRLTPEECELLQGFPIGYTLLPDAKGKRKPDDLSDSIDYLVALGFPLEHARRVAATPDGPRYKALGNSWAVPCVRWIARRIEAMLSNPNILHPAP